jgi:DNA-binding HxlR family transcriptional regulator
MTVTTEDHCAVRRDVLRHVGSKWSALVLTLLDRGPLRYSEIRRSCRITPRMLTLTLAELRQDGLIRRDSAAGDPPQHVYALSAAGRSLVGHINALISWSDQHQEHILDSRRRFGAADEVTPRR